MGVVGDWPWKFRGHTSLDNGYQRVLPYVDELPEGRCGRGAAPQNATRASQGTHVVGVVGDWPWKLR